MKIVPRCRSIILAFCPPFFISVNKTQFYAYGDTFNFRRLFNTTILRYVFIDVINETVAYEYFIIDGTFYTSCGSSSINPHLSWLQMLSACFQHIITIYFDSHVSWASPTYEVFMLYVVVLSMGHFRTFRYKKKKNLIISWWKSNQLYAWILWISLNMPDSITQPKNVEEKYTNLNNNNKTHTIKTEKKVKSKCLFVQDRFMFKLCFPYEWHLR